MRTENMYEQEWDGCNWVYYKVLSRREARKYGWNLSRKWTPLLSTKEIVALFLYKGFWLSNFHKQINEALRKECKSKWRAVADVISSALAKSTINTNIVCYRETSAHFLRANKTDAESIQKGDVLIEKGFFSTYSYRPPFKYAQIHLIILVPRGSTGAYINAISPFFRFEQEFLFKDGTRLEVLEIYEKSQQLYLKLKIRTDEGSN